MQSIKCYFNKIEAHYNPPKSITISKHYSACSVHYIDTSADVHKGILINKLAPQILTTTAVKYHPNFARQHPPIQ